MPQPEKVCKWCRALEGEQPHDVNSHPGPWRDADCPICKASPSEKHNKGLHEAATHVRRIKIPKPEHHIQDTSVPDYVLERRHPRPDEIREIK